MSYQEKRSIANVMSSLLVVTIYGFFVFRRLQDGGMAQLNDFAFWGRVFLLLVPLTIATHIVVMILFTIFYQVTTNEEGPSFSDERDKLIELKSLKNSHWVFALAFFLAMASQAVGMPPFVMFLMFILGGTVSEVVEGVSQLVLYRKGV